MARRIMILAGLAIVLTGYLIFFRDRDDVIIWFSLGLVILVVVYTFQFQIDQLMIRGVPQKLDEPMRQMLLATAPQFVQMSPASRAMVEDRMKRWVIKKEFINKNEQDAPEDVKYILAWYAVMLTMHQASFLYDGVDRIVFYHHPFLTPTHPDDVHIFELEKEDGTIIISVPHLIRGHMEKGFYNLALHAMAEAYRVCYFRQAISWPADIWNKLEAISSIPRQRIDAYIGLAAEDPWPVAVHHQFTYKGASVPEVQMVLPQTLSSSAG